MLHHENNSITTMKNGIHLPNANAMDMLEKDNAQ